MELVKFGIGKAALIVDDDNDLREAVSYDFAKRGFTIYTSADGNEAMEIIKNHHIDIIVSDIQMQNCDGICLLKKVQVLPNEKPIFLLMSGFSNYDKEKVQEMGALTIISKPIDRREMLTIVKEALESKEE